MLFVVAALGAVLAKPALAQTVGGGESHGYVVDGEGIVWTVGLNSQGRLGDGTTTQRRERVWR